MEKLEPPPSGQFRLWRDARKHPLVDNGAISSALIRHYDMEPRVGLSFRELRIQVAERYTLDYFLFWLVDEHGNLYDLDRPVRAGMQVIVATDTKGDVGPYMDSQVGVYYLQCALAAMDTIAAAVAHALPYPLLVVIARRFAMLYDGSAAQVEGAPFSSMSFAAVVSQIYKESGISGFFRGVVPMCLHMAVVPQLINSSNLIFPSRTIFTILASAMFFGLWPLRDYTWNHVARLPAAASSARTASRILATIFASAPLPSFRFHLRQILPSCLLSFGRTLMTSVVSQNTISRFSHPLALFVVASLGELAFHPLISLETHRRVNMLGAPLKLVAQDVWRRRLLWTGAGEFVMSEVINSGGKLLVHREGFLYRQTRRLVHYLARKPGKSDTELARQLAVISTSVLGGSVLVTMSLCAYFRTKQRSL